MSIINQQEATVIDYCKVKPEALQPQERIPDPLIFPFSVFMQNGGYEVGAAKNGVVFKKGKAVGRIYGSWVIREKTYSMNEHCIARFKMFNELYLKTGRLFIDELTKTGVAKLPPSMSNQKKMTVIV